MNNISDSFHFAEIGVVAVFVFNWMAMKDYTKVDVKLQYLHLFDACWGCLQVRALKPVIYYSLPEAMKE